jgi:hypothetical protein
MPRKRKAETELEELEDMVQTKRVAKGKKQKPVKGKKLQYNLCRTTTPLGGEDC